MGPDHGITIIDIDDKLNDAGGECLGNMTYEDLWIRVTPTIRGSFLMMNDAMALAILQGQPVDLKVLSIITAALI